MIESIQSYLPEQASNWGTPMDLLNIAVILVCAVSFFIVEFALIYLVIRYRRRSGEEDKITPAIVHNAKLEIIWTIIPTIVMFILFFWGAKLFYDMRKTPKDTYEIQVEARKWSWKFLYNNGVNISTQSTCSDAQYGSEYSCEQEGHKWTEGKHFIVPVGRKISLKMTSVDVIHSLYIPAFRVKQDVTPGSISSLWFEATKEGTYDLFCAEYCGLWHSGMISKVEVVSEAKFNQWLIQTKIEQERQNNLAQTPELLAKMGSDLFKTKGCVACHSLNDQRLVGPALNNIFGKERSFIDGSKGIVDENYLSVSIINPNAKVVAGYPPAMPPQDANATELKALVEYLKSCKTKECK